MNYRNLLPVLTLYTLVLFSSCMKSDYFPCIRAKGQVVEEYRNVINFNAVDLRLHGNVYIAYGEEYSVALEAPENILEYIETRNGGQSLIIENTRCIRNSANEITVYITMPDVSFLRLSGSGNIIVEDVFEGERIRLDISGSGNIFIDGNFSEINSSISGSGNVNISGFATNQSVSISGSGKVNALNLLSKRADVRISGSGNASINAEDFIDARISGSGNVYYKGNPAISVSISGSGKIIHL